MEGNALKTGNNPYYVRLVALLPPVLPQIDAERVLEPALRMPVRLGTNRCAAPLARDARRSLPAVGGNGFVDLKVVDCALKTVTQHYNRSRDESDQAWGCPIRYFRCRSQQSWLGSAGESLVTGQDFDAESLFDASVSVGYRCSATDG